MPRCTGGFLPRHQQRGSERDGSEDPGGQPGRAPLAPGAAKWADRAPPGLQLPTAPQAAVGARDRGPLALAAGTLGVSHRDRRARRLRSCR